MFRATLILFGFVVGLLQGVFMFLLIDYLDFAPLRVVEPEVWSKYGMLMSGAFGAVLGAGLGLTAHVIINKRGRELILAKSVRGLDGPTNRQARS